MQTLTNKQIRKEENAKTIVHDSTSHAWHHSAVNDPGLMNTHFTN
jgi:hypothetical protein